MMSTTNSIVNNLILFIIIAGVCVTQETTSECFANNVDTFMDVLQNCSPHDIFDSGYSITNATLSAFCPSQCAIAVNTFFETACNLSYSEIFCSRNEDNTRYCMDFQYIDDRFSENILQPMQAACNNTNCSQSDACNASVQALPCCLNQVNRYLTEIDGRPALLSGDCTVVSSVCNVPDYMDSITTYTEPALTTQMTIGEPNNSGARAVAAAWVIVVTILVSSCGL